MSGNVGDVLLCKEDDVVRTPSAGRQRPKAVNLIQFVVAWADSSQLDAAKPGEDLSSSQRSVKQPCTAP